MSDRIAVVTARTAGSGVKSPVNSQPETPSSRPPAIRRAPRPQPENSPIAASRSALGFYRDGHPLSW